MYTYYFLQTCMTQMPLIYDDNESIAVVHWVSLILYRSGLKGYKQEINVKGAIIRVIHYKGH